MPALLSQCLPDRRYLDDESSRIVSDSLEPIFAIEADGLVIDGVNNDKSTRGYVGRLDDACQRIMKKLAAKSLALKTLVKGEAS